MTTIDQGYMERVRLNPCASPTGIAVKYTRTLNCEKLQKCKIWRKYGQNQTANFRRGTKAATQSR